jgi:hypothetical protein
VCVGALTLYFVIYVAGAQDVLAFYLQAPQPPVTIGLQVLGIALPILAGLVTWRICRGMASAGRLPETEPPIGSHKEAKPPVEMYLPERARFEPVAAPEPAEPGTTGDRAVPAPLRRLATLVTGVGTGWALGRLRRQGGSPATGDPPPAARGRVGETGDGG